MMDRHAAQAIDSIVMTQVARKIFDRLQYALEEKEMLRIEGDTRVGKTEAVHAYCHARPGLARLVLTPCSNGDYDFFQAVAESAGLEVTLDTPLRELKHNVEFIIRHGGLMWILDEAHFLVPARIYRNTPPMRLNWIRTRIADHGCPLVLVTTPQDFKHGTDKLTKVTGYNLNQFTGRTLLVVRLPSELSTADLIAIARKHFPKLNEDYLELIAAKAMQSESYLKAVEAIGKLSRFIARQAGRDEPTLADVDAAIAEYAPTIPIRPAPSAAVASGVRQPLAVKRGRPVAPVAAATALPAPVRQTSPAPAQEIPARGTTPILQTQ
jgi:hypothetical protein